MTPDATSDSLLSGVTFGPEFITPSVDNTSNTSTWSIFHAMTGAHASRLILRSALSRNAVTAPRYGLRSLHSGTEAKQKSLADKYTEKLERAAKECEVFRCRVYPL